MTMLHSTHSPSLPWTKRRRTGWLSTVGWAATALVVMAALCVVEINHLQGHITIGNLDYFAMVARTKNLPSTLSAWVNGFYPAGIPLLARFGLSLNVDVAHFGRIVSLFGGLLCALGTAALALSITRSRVFALIAMACLVSTGTLLFYAGYEGTDMLAAGLQVLALGVLSRNVQNRKLALLAGVITGLGFLIRYTALLSFLVCAFYCVVLAIYHKDARRLWSAAFYGLGFAIGAAPQIIATLIVTGKPSIQKNHGRLVIADAEEAWFVRVNHIDHYGTDVHLERLTAEATTPMLFLNIDAVPRGRALIWEHIADAPGKRCPNPRVVIPRSVVPDIVNEPVRVDIRSFGVRTPPCTRDNPTYGIIGLFQLLPPALAWLWRLTAPRGHENPSITDSNGMSSEGVGSYWPFATGRKVDQANLLLAQFRDNTRTRYILSPSQYIGAWRVGFMPQWVTREYMARRGAAPFKPEQLRPTRCPLLGYRLHHLQVEGRFVTNYLTKVEIQPEVGEEAYDIGAGILVDFFHKCLKEFDMPDLLPLGRQIIECCFDGGSVADYDALIPSHPAD